MRYDTVGEIMDNLSEERQRQFRLLSTTINVRDVFSQVGINMWIFANDPDVQKLMNLTDIQVLIINKLGYSFKFLCTLFWCVSLKDLKLFTKNEFIEYTQTVPIAKEKISAFLQLPEIESAFKSPTG